jgi:hypothetical protein
MKRIFTACLCIAFCATAGCVSLPGAGVSATKATGASATIRDTAKAGVSASPADSNGDGGDFSLFTAEPTQEAPTQAVEASATAQASTTAATASSASGNREDISRAEMLAFFKEVVFGAAPGSVARKWVAPIIVTMTGDYNANDGEQLTNIFDMLNEYDGFPGVHYLSAEAAGAVANMTVKFVTEDVLRSEEPDWDGESPLWAAYKYNGEGNLYKSTIYLVSGNVSNQAKRNYLLTWGVFYTLGFFNDSGIYYDSMFSPDFEYGQLSNDYYYPVKADWYLVSMLYAPAVKAGMTFRQAAAALRN